MLDCVWARFALAIVAAFGLLEGGLAGPAAAAPGDAFIIVANKTYRSGIAPVEFADRDAEAMEKAAREVLGLDRFGIRRFDDMTGSEALGWFQPNGTPGDDLKAFVRRASQGRRDATIYFYYSGHGVTARNALREIDELHLVLHDTRTDAVSRQGLSIEAVRRSLTLAQQELLPDGKVVMLIDACFSGFGRDGKEVWTGARAGAVPASIAPLERVVLLAAAGPSEPAWSDLNRKHGAFTDAVIDGLYGAAAGSDGQITAERLMAFVGRRVAGRLLRQPEGERFQTPMLTGDGSAVIASLDPSSPIERVPGHRARMQRRCAVIGASGSIGLMREFLKSECDEDCACRTDITAKVGDIERLDRVCREEREELAALMAAGPSARSAIEAMGRVAQCAAVKAEIAAGVTELLCRKDRADLAMLKAQGTSAIAAIVGLGRTGQCPALKSEIATAAAALREQQCRDERGELAKLKARGLPARTELLALGSAAGCVAVKGEVIAAVAEIDAAERCRLERIQLDALKPRDRSARADLVALSQRVSCAEVKAELAAAIAALDDPALTVVPGSGKTFRDKLANGQDCPHCPEMVVVPAGSFIMGSPEGEAWRNSDEGPQRRVTFARPFAAGKFEVTFTEWDACVARGGCNGYRPADSGWGRGRQPVINVSWNDAKAYMEWLSRSTGRSYRLLSEAEWEYSARAGTTTPYSTGRTINPDQAKFDGVHRQQPVAIGSFRPNAWGLHDMHGNVFELVEDCWNESYIGAPTDGSAWTAGDCGVRGARGGSWGANAVHIRSAIRTRGGIGNRGDGIGFRVGRSLSQ